MNRSMQLDVTNRSEAIAKLKPTRRYRPAAESSALLLIIFLTNLILRNPSSGSFAYFFPLVVATYRGGLRNGLPVFLLTSLAVNVTLALGGGVERGGVVLNVVLSTLIFAGVMLLSDRSRTDLRRTVARSSYDELTGARNRTSITEVGQKEVNRTVAAGEPFVLAMIDLDKFKELNDGYGHAFGDAVLKELVGTLKRNLSANDSVGRTGGDEFLVVMPNRTLEEAESLLVQAGHSFADRTFVAGLPSSFSFGLGTPGRDGFSWAAMLDAADQDMYRRKTAKKAQVEMRNAS